MRRRALGVFGGVAAALATLLGVAAPPAAAVPLVTALDCESNSSFLNCNLSFVNAVGPVTIRWYVNGAHWAPSDDSTFLRRGCAANVFQPVLVVITDSTGAAQERGGAICRR